MRLSSVEPKTSCPGADLLAARRMAAMNEVSVLHARRPQRHPERPGEQVTCGLLLASGFALSNPDFV